ncbi:uncharacterized protein LOC115921343 [Strongylocentrotus purpuratus]|uniref:Ig-like domain-containing protein n=1 Tax=Strongylocentrotus purpuratus TaxID=7668 RepID=A0A7M7NGA9_STRPU|nr:uncharacterized protein LOC115921343 [Strongylocentrotus purpuratus]
MILHVCSLQGVNCDVPDGVVYTDLHKTAQKGDELVLKCQFYGTPIAVYWKKGHDPTNSPNLITWVEGESASGSCVHDESCKMNATFSLIIRNITVSDQGSYICRVSNYKGILIHNFTEVSVFAPPMEPFPLIDECPGKLPNDAEQTCSLSTANSIIITCSASSYFPDIDLFFLHESKRMGATTIKEVANMDGTKNKSIFTLAEPSESPYVCVASDIPGSQDQRTVTVTVTFLGSTVAMTTSSNQTTLPPNQRGDVAKVGKVSFFELWYLVNNMDQTNLNILRDVLVDLVIPVVNEELTKKEAYDLLCHWKDANTLDNEGMMLKSVLNGYGLEHSWKEMCERRHDTTSTVSEELFDHVLRSIGCETKICQFIRELITEEPKTPPNVSGNRRDVTEESMVVLREWRDREQTVSQIIQICLALERAKCQPEDRTFFKATLYPIIAAPLGVRAIIFG